MTDRIAHATISVERSYPQSPAKVWRAHADQATRRRWFAEGDGFIVDDYRLDFRVGGIEATRFRFGEDGPPMTQDAVFHDLIENERMVFTYTMTIAGAPLSVSTGTVELTPKGQGTHLRYTEQGVFFGDQDLRGREEGTRQLFERLAAELNG